MKRFSFFLALTALMVFSFGLAHGATSLDLSNVTGIVGSATSDTVGEGKVVTFTIELDFTPGDGDTITGPTNGFEVYVTKNGAYTDNFSPLVGATIYPMKTVFDGGFFINPFSCTGTGADTIGFGGYSVDSGLVDGFVNDVYTLTTTPSLDGDTLCIDSSWYRPSNDWLWSTVFGEYYPAWGGPYCYHVYHIPNPAPVITDCPGTLILDHCVAAQVVLTVTNIDAAGAPGEAFTATLLTPLGAITHAPPTSATVTWDYNPVLADVTNGPYTICIEAKDAAGGVDTCCFNVTFTNTGPDCSPHFDSILIVVGQKAEYDFNGSDDCDPFHFYKCAADPVPVGPWDVDVNTGEFTFNSAALDAGILYTFTIGVSDGVDSCCCCTLKVYCSAEPFMSVWIDKIHKVHQGQFVYVPVVKIEANMPNPIGGFDVVIAFDRSALNFHTVLWGPLRTECLWEYFTYRWWMEPSYFPHFFWGGIVKVVGIAETNNGPAHPDKYCLPLDDYWATDDIDKGYEPWPADSGTELFKMKFLVTDNRQFECMFVPMYFFWKDCTDNSFSGWSGDTLWVEERVYHYDTARFIEVGEEYRMDIVDPEDSTFPSFFGLMDPVCLVGTDKNDPVPLIYFYNGGVNIVCADSIDARGDLNLNGIPNEIADAVVFTNYFIYGFTAFHIDVDGQTAASDVNCDGLPLTVGDLVYLIRVIVGDDLPYPKLAPVEANYRVADGVVSVDKKMGAALVVVRGDVTPTLLADNMDIKYAYNAEENVTRVLVYSLAGNGFSGEFLNANGGVVSIELGSYEGAVVKATEVPADFALHQNYPNPFNPTTTISFNLPVATDYTLTVYNVTGQQVTEFAGESEAGMVSIEWDASNMASGIYFYKLNAGDFSATKKMVLLK